jgi:hypothetical protein
LHCIARRFERAREELNECDRELRGLAEENGIDVHNL